MASTIAIVANRMQAAMCVDWSLRRFGLGLVVSVDLWPVVDVARRAGVSQVLRSRDARAGSRLDPRVDAHHHHARASVVVSTSARICSCMSSMGICTAKPTNEGGVFPCIPAGKSVPLIVLENTLCHASNSGPVGSQKPKPS